MVGGAYWRIGDPPIAAAEGVHRQPMARRVLATAEGVQRQPMARPVLATAEGVQRQPITTVYDLKIYRLLTYALKFYCINFKSLKMKNVSVIMSQRKSFKLGVRIPTAKDLSR